MALLRMWDGTAWVNIGGNNDAIHPVGPTAPASPALGTLWLDTVTPAPATNLLYGPNGEMMLSAAGQGSVGRITRTTGPQEDVHLRSGDALGSIAAIEAANAVYLGGNLYFDGVNWNRFDTARSGGMVAVSYDGALTLYSVAAGANPVVAFTYRSLTPADFAKLLDWPKVRLNFVDTINELTGASAIASQEFTVTTAQSFTVNSPSSILQVDCNLAGVIATAATGSMEGAINAVVDWGGAYQKKRLSGFYSPGPTGTFVGFVGGSCQFTALAAGTHTITLTCIASNATTSYLRCATYPNWEHAGIMITELNP
jgi:hypothetical protein